MTLCKDKGEAQKNWGTEEVSFNLVIKELICNFHQFLDLRS